LDYNISTDANRPYIPNYALSAADWKANVQILKQTILENRTHRNINMKNNPNLTSHFQSNNKVEIIDKCYLEKWFYTTDLETSIESQA
jgi:hypothetical protein